MNNEGTKSPQKEKDEARAHADGPARVTLRSWARTHFGEALAVRQSEPVGWRTIAVAALGMIVPVIAGVALGHAEIGFTIGLGAMLLAGPTATPDAEAAQERRSPATAVLPAIVAVLAATAIAGHAWSDVAMVLLATTAASVSGYSRPVGVAAIRFIVYFVLSLGLLDAAGSHRAGAALIFGLGALWNIVVRLMLSRKGPAPAEMAGAKPSPTHVQLRANWRRTMRELAGWQFPIRLGAGLAMASVARAAWPAHHYGWIVLTVALLTQRPLEHVPIKLTQRALGTLLGVGLTWVALSSVSSTLALAALICLLAVLAPIARARSYLAYASISTPAILLVLDLEKPIETILLVDRLVATLAGAAIVIAANLAADRWLPKPTPKAVRRRAPADGAGVQPSSTASVSVEETSSPPAAGRSK